MFIQIARVTHSTILGGVQGTLDTTGTNANTALTKISQNIERAGDGQGSSLTSLLAALRNLDSHNKNGLDGILTNIGGIKSVLDLIGASTHARTNLVHHDPDHIVTRHSALQKSFIDENTVTRHGTLTAVPQYGFINENIVNVHPEQSESQQTGIKATAGSFSDDQSNPQPGGSECGGGLFTDIGCNVQIQLGRTLSEEVNRISSLDLTMPTIGFMEHRTNEGPNQTNETHLTNNTHLPSTSALQDLRKTRSQRILSR